MVTAGATAAIPAAADTAYVASFGQGVGALDTVSGAQRDSIPGSQGGAMAITPDGATVYVSSFRSIQVIDAAANRVKATIPVAGSLDFALTPDGRSLIVTSWAENRVSILSTATNAPVATLAISHPGKVVVSPSGDTAYVLRNGPAATDLVPIDLDTRALWSPIALARHTASDIAVTPDGTLALVIGGEGQSLGPDWIGDEHGYVQIVDLARRMAEPPIAAGDRRLLAVAVAPDGQTAYLAHKEIRDVHGDAHRTAGVVPFDIASRTVGAPLAINPLTISALAVTGDGGNLIGTVPFGDARGVTGWTFDYDLRSGGPARTLSVSNLGAMGPMPFWLTLVPGPSASFTAEVGPIGMPSGFHAGASVNAGGTIASYTWEFGDGTPAEVTTSARTTHTYSVPGTYTVTLTTRNHGGCASRLVYTGKTASCSGLETATTSRTLTVTSSALGSGPASAITGSVRAPGATRATLHGTVTASGTGASWYFEYGKSTRYGRSTARQSLPARSGTIAVRSRVANLSPRTRYHYRLVVETAVRPGLSYGRDASFRTAPAGHIRLRAKRLLVDASIRVRLSCHSGRPCRGRLQLSTRRGQALITCGRATVRIAPGKAARTRIEVRARCRSLLRRHPLRAEVITALTSGQRDLRATVRLTPPPRGGGSVRSG